MDDPGDQYQNENNQKGLLNDLWIFLLTSTNEFIHAITNNPLTKKDTPAGKIVRSPQCTALCLRWMNGVIILITLLKNAQSGYLIHKSFCQMFFEEYVNLHSCIRYLFD